MALAVQEEIAHRIEEAESLRRSQLERARYEAELARRRYLKVDPDNRLVADALEADWNDRLRQLDTLQREHERQRATDRGLLSEEARARSSLAKDFYRVWNDPRTAPIERKRMVAPLIEDVTLVKADKNAIHVRFRGGKTTSLAIDKPKPIAPDPKDAPRGGSYGRRTARDLHRPASRSKAQRAGVSELERSKLHGQKGHSHPHGLPIEEPLRASARPRHADGRRNRQEDRRMRHDRSRVGSRGLGRARPPRHRAQFDLGVKIDLLDLPAGREVRGRQSGEAKRRDAGYPVGRDRLAQRSEQEARVAARHLMRIVAADLRPPERGVSASKAAHQQRR